MTALSHTQLICDGMYSVSVRVITSTHRVNWTQLMICVWIQYISLFPWPITFQHPFDMQYALSMPCASRDFGSQVSDTIPAHG